MSLFVLTGESSGDQFAAGLIKDIWQQRPELPVYGVCGPALRAIGVQPVGSMETFQTIFPASVVLMPYLIWQASKIHRAILELNPKVCVFVDASYFSFKMAERLRESGYQGKIIKYICPATWWPDHGRQAKLERLFDAAISIFPHEKRQYVGHPLFSDPLPATKPEPVLGLFPGSRLIELRFGLKKLLKACVLYQEKHPEIPIEVSCAAQYFRPRLEKVIARFPKNSIRLVDTSTSDKKQAFLSRLQLAIAKPGTINLELARYRVPTLIAYPLYDWIRWIMLKKLRLIKSHHAMINMVYGQEVFPELLVNDAFTPHKAVGVLENWDVNRIQKACLGLCQHLKNPDPSHTAAKIVLGFLEDYTHVLFNPTRRNALERPRQTNQLY